MTVHDRAAKTYKTLNDAGRSHDECLREAVNAVIEAVAEDIDHPNGKGISRWFANRIRALSNGGQ